MHRLMLLLLFCSSLPGFSQLNHENFALKQIILPQLTTFQKKLQLPSLVLLPIEVGMESTNTNCLNNGGCFVLPLTSLTLDGKRFTPVSVKLKWKTINEFNTSRFDIERSFINTGGFSKTGFINAIINPLPENEYTFEDDNDHEGITFYRLKQLDIDGRFTYSNIISVDGVALKESIQLFPNPAINLVQLQVIVKKNSNGYITIFDMAGKLLMQKSQFFSKGISTISVNAASLSHGIFSIKVSRLNEMDMVLKFVKY